MSFSIPRNKTISGAAFAAIVLHLVFLAASVAAAPSAESPRPKAAKLAPAPTTTPQLVIDLQRQVIHVRLAGVALREYAFTVPDGGMNGGFIENESPPPSEVPIVESVHLIAAAETIPQVELQIIAEETGLGADQIQRYLPGKMLLITNKGLRIYIQTDCPTAKTFRWQWIKDAFRRVWGALTWQDSLHLGMSAEDAMSLYGVAKNRPQITVRQ